MRAHKIVVSVPVSRHVEIDLPADFPEGDAEFIAISAGEPAGPAGSSRPGSIEADRAARAAVDAMDFPRRSKEEIDAYLAEERASWGDEAP